MGLRSRLVSIFALAVLVALGPVQAGDDELFVRIVQVKGTGTREQGKKAEIDKPLEPLRAHLEKASNHSRYSMLGKSSTKKGPAGQPIAFELENKLRAEATPSPGADKKVNLGLKVNRRDGKKDELVFETKLEMRDGATGMPLIENVLDGGALILAITASRDPL